MTVKVAVKVAVKMAGALARHVTTWTRISRASRAMEHEKKRQWQKKSARKEPPMWYLPMCGWFVVGQLLVQGMSSRCAGRGLGATSGVTDFSLSLRRRQQPMRPTATMASGSAYIAASRRESSDGAVTGSGGGGEVWWPALWWLCRAEECLRKLASISCEAEALTGMRRCRQPPLGNPQPRPATLPLPPPFTPFPDTRSLSCLQHELGLRGARHEHHDEEPHQQEG